MKKIFKLPLILVLLFIVIVVIPSIQIAHSFSQTFELGQGVYTGITAFELQVGDRVEGSFSVSNLGPYERLFGSGTSYEVVDVWCEDPNGQSILNFSATPSENSFSFNFTANEQGLYHIGTFSGAMDYLKDAKNPVLTLNFDIVEAEMSPSPVPQTFPMTFILGMLAITFTVIILSIMLLIYRRKKSQSKASKDS